MTVIWTSRENELCVCVTFWDTAWNVQECLESLWGLLDADANYDVPQSSWCGFEQSCGSVSVPCTPTPQLRCGD